MRDAPLTDTDLDTGKPSRDSNVGDMHVSLPMIPGCKHFAIHVNSTVSQLYSLRMWANNKAESNLATFLLVVD